MAYFPFQGLALKINILPYMTNKPFRKSSKYLWPGSGAWNIPSGKQALLGTHDGHALQVNRPCWALDDEP